MGAFKEERRQYKTGGYYSEHGRSNITIYCPFCSRQQTVYIWSLRGSGKRCENELCRVFFGSLGFATKDARSLLLVNRATRVEQQKQQTSIYSETMETP